MDEETLYRMAERELSPRRFCHVKGVKETAEALALRYGADPYKAGTAALLHDLLREKNKEEILALAARYGVQAETFETAAPQVLHGPVAAKMAQRDFGIQDREILRAVTNHTLAGPGMGKLERILFLSDMIEPGRDYPGVEALRRLSEQDLDQAYLAALQSSIVHLRKTGKQPAQRTLEALKEAEGKQAQKPQEEETI